MSKVNYELLFKELIKRMNEEELIRMVRRSERNMGENELSLYMRNEIKARRKEEGGLR
jgi:hypothetical protein